MHSDGARKWSFRRLWFLGSGFGTQKGLVDFGCYDVRSATYDCNGLSVWSKISACCWSGIVNRCLSHFTEMTHTQNTTRRPGIHVACSECFTHDR